MSVFSILTSIADKIRSLLGISDKLGLVAMSTNLETANTEVLTQEELMNQIIVALEGKSVSGGTAKEEQEKSVDIIENGTTEVLPDDGKVLSKVTVNVDVQSGGDGGIDIDTIIVGSYPNAIVSDVEEIRMYGFYQWINIPKVEFSVVSQVKNYTFYMCTNLKIADFANVSAIGTFSFRKCESLVALILRKQDVVCSLGNANSLLETPIENGTGFIYVPKSLIDTYKAAPKWVNYANQFRALEDYTVDGTITGALDESKI